MMLLREYMRLAYDDALKARFLHVSRQNYARLQAHLKPSTEIQRKVGRMKAMADDAVVAGLERLKRQQANQRARHHHGPHTPPFTLDHWPTGRVDAPLVVPADIPIIYVSAAPTPGGDLVVVALTIQPGNRTLNRLNARLYARHWREHGMVLPDTLPKTVLTPLTRSLVYSQDPPAPAIFFKDAGKYQLGWWPYLATITHRLQTQLGRVNIYVDVPAALRTPPRHRHARQLLIAQADRNHQPHPLFAYIERQRSLGLQAAHLVAYTIANLPRQQTQMLHIERLYGNTLPQARRQVL
ncbi:MAG: hypothetical protein LKJ69_08110 [Lactobacillus sp.]|nr:hypothetical protein [Lactobacillus sp.]